MQSSKIKSVEINSLFAHPKNPNVMSKANMQKLSDHIKATGNYEPVIVRTHPKFGDKFEIINGHHRIAVLRSLGYESVDCIVWDVDDEQVLLLLQSLNRLKGKDDIDKKSALIKELTQKYDSKALAKMLPDAKRTIDKFANLSSARLDENSIARAYLNSLVFMVDDSQCDTIKSAIAKAGKGLPKSSKAKTQASALAKICEQYVEARS